MPAHHSQPIPWPPSPSHPYRPAITVAYVPAYRDWVGIAFASLQGMYNKRPPQPRCTSTWDVQVVLQHPCSLGNNASLGRKKLSLKLVMLMALANASMCSELHALDIERMRFSVRGVTFSLTKTSKSGTNRILFYPVLSSDKEVCPVLTSREYLKRTSKERKQSKLFLSCIKSYSPVKPCSLARWLKEILVEVGYQDFKAHSTRGAAVSAAYSQGISVADIIKIAAWSSDMLKTHYYKPILDSKSASFSQFAKN